jgi:hypothetical protein
MTASGRPVRIRLLELPVAIHERAQAHSDELQREFRLMAEQAPDHRQFLPVRLTDLVVALNRSYSMHTTEQEARLEAAMSAHEPVIDELVYEVPTSAVDAAVTLGRMLDEADDFCRAGRHLLTLETPPDLLAYRRWYLGQFVAQAAGAAPVPWPQFSGGPRLLR